MKNNTGLEGGVPAWSLQQISLCPAAWDGKYVPRYYSFDSAFVFYVDFKEKHYKALIQRIFLSFHVYICINVHIYLFPLPEQRWCLPLVMAQYLVQN